MTLDGHDPKTTIFPTFECFSDGMEFIDHIARLCPEKINDISLVHAICTADDGTEYSHGWVEDGKQEICIFCGVYMDEKIYFAARFEDFFKGYKVKEFTRYSVWEALQNNVRTINYGPWEEKYIALCGKGGTIVGGGMMQNVGVIGSLPKPTTEKGKQE
jgi:hypothetical protein